MREVIPESGGRVGESCEVELLFCMVFHPHFECDGETEKMTEEIVVVHSKESALEDTVELCH